MSFLLAVQAQSSDQLYRDYIQQYHEIAVRQQRAHGIPASIILAQGLLESGAGKSRLATLANNHFGIKCHDWTGQTIYHDDDEQNECFRKYRHPRESYEDHSLFLVNRPRYQSLFLLKPDDYAGWAHGLKAAGYATDPNYAHKLISLIERYELHQYDKMRTSLFASRRDSDETTVSAAGTDGPREVYRSNYIKIVVAAPGDSFTSLAGELSISERRLRRFNEVDETAVLRPGNIVYLSKKKKKAAAPNRIHVVQPGETLYSISQVYGIQLLSLYKLNQLSYNDGAYIGQILKLR